jgi:hypothetical protein
LPQFAQNLAPGVISAPQRLQLAPGGALTIMVDL